MTIELTGALGLVFTIVTLLTSIVIMICGAVVIWNWLIIQILFDKLFLHFKWYKYFVGYINYRRRFKEWYDEQVRLEEQEEKELKLEKSPLGKVSAKI